MTHRCRSRPATSPTRHVDQHASTRAGREHSVSDQVLDLDSVWTRAIAGLGEDLVSAQQRAWLRLTKPLALVQDTVVLATPNDFARDVLDTRLRPLVIDALSRELARDVRVAVTVEPEAQAAADAADRRAAMPTRSTSRTPTDELEPAPVTPIRRAQRAGTGSTRSTSSTPSSSDRATGSPTPRRSRSPRRRPRRTTRCSSTASPGWARPTCCTRSGTTPARSCRAAGCGT